MATVGQRTFVFLIGADNVSQHVSAAFWDKGVAAAVPDVPKGVAAESADVAPALSLDEVDKMLAVPESWRLAVSAGGKDDVPSVLTKTDLQEKRDAEPTGAVEVKLRPLTPSEKLLLDSTPKLFSPEASMDRLKEALALPVTQAGLVATAAGLFGLLALRDKIEHVWLMQLAVFGAALAIVVSLVGRYALKEIRIKPARLDLLEAQNEATIRGSISRARAGLWLLVAAIVLALLSTIPAGSDKTAAASIALASAESVDGVTTASVAVTWSNLGDSVDRIVTVVRQGDKTLVQQVTPSKGEASVSQELKPKLGAAAVVEVTTHTLAKNGDEVGTGASKRLAIPEAAS